MSTVQWVLLCAGVGAVCGIAAWIYTLRVCNGRISEYKSIRKAVEGAGEELKEVNGALDSAKEDLGNQRRQLTVIEKRTAELVALEARASEIRDTVANGKSLIEAVNSDIDATNEAKSQLANELQDLKAEADLYTRVTDFIDFGIFEEPEYLYETSERYRIEIQEVRNQQKEMIANKKAIELPADILVDGSSQKGTSILAGQAKMMLRAFNIECDLLIGKVSPSNFARTLERIEKNADSLEKSAISLMCGISLDYVKLKFEECKLFYEFKLKRAAEQEEQKQIREQIREEQKAAREYQRALAEAEKEEQMYAEMLERAKEELEQAQEGERAEFAAKIALLEEQLREAQEKEQRAKSLAEQTRRGHVYVISNIGSFGEDVYKIGLTRRLDPIDRVKELGDASVPFPFDVHAIIYSEDAPNLEATLHRKFNHRRVNAVNHRKEFFRVTLDDIRGVVDDTCEEEAEFRVTALAEEYYETLRLQGADSSAA